MRMQKGPTTVDCEGLGRELGESKRKGLAGRKGVKAQQLVG
jgi:hypothetical protein